MEMNSVMEMATAKQLWLGWLGEICKDGQTDLETFLHANPRWIAAEFDCATNLISSPSVPRGIMRCHETPIAQISLELQFYSSSQHRIRAFYLFQSFPRLN